MPVMQNEKGFIGLPVLMAIVLGLMIVGGGAYYVTHRTAAPAADSLAAMPTPGGAPLSVDFVATSRAAIDLIDFGDGKTVSSEGVQNEMEYDSWDCTAAGPASPCRIRHLYSAPGTYTATIYDSQKSDLGSATITLAGTDPAKPSATIDQSSLGNKANTGSSIVLGGSYSGTTAIMVTVTRAAYGPNLPAHLEYSFGSGSPDLQESKGRWTATLPKSDSGNAPLANGTYTVAVHDNSNGTDSGDNPILTTGTLMMIAPAHQYASFNAAPDSGSAPLDVAFYSMFAPASSTVDFGDGTSASDWGPTGGGDASLSLSHTYTKPGVYTATLTSDNGTATVKITVSK